MFNPRSKLCLENLPEPRYVFDIETNGLDDSTLVHCIVVADLDRTNHRWSYGPTEIQAGLRKLEEAGTLIGHNIIQYDLPQLERLCGWDVRSVNSQVKLIDTLLLSRLLNANLHDQDFASGRKTATFNLPAKLYGSHALKAWGYRLGELKGTYGEENGFASFTPELLEYCQKDVEIEARLFHHFLQQGIPLEACKIEMEFAEIISHQERRGVRFDEEKATSLYATLSSRRQQLEQTITHEFKGHTQVGKKAAFYKVVEPDGTEGTRLPTKGACEAWIKTQPKEKRKDFFIVPGPPVEKYIPFNPSSRQQVGDKLIELGWNPTSFTPTGQPIINEKTLDEAFEVVHHPLIAPLKEYFLLQKRLGQLAEGKEGWLKVCRNGRVYGKVNTLGTLTGRCAHHSPNLGQVPRVGSPYGEECRSLFTADEGMVLVGWDASGLELRGLAHFLAPYDGGSYIKVVTEGDVHTHNQKAAGLATRDKAKTFIYALIYGAGDYKLGCVAGVTPEEVAEYGDSKRDRERLAKFFNKSPSEVLKEDVAKAKKGSILRARFEKNLPGYSELKDSVQDAWRSRNGLLLGIDGRPLRPRGQHSALNTIIQSMGAVVVKKATNCLHECLIEEGWKLGQDWYPSLHVHDEQQLNVRPLNAQYLGLLAVECIRGAGIELGIRCPLSGEFKIGPTWKDTH